MKGRITLFIILLMTLSVHIVGERPPTVEATETPISLEDTEQGLPRPHLGYGIHVAPHTGVDPGWVDRIGMDWVKVYTLPQVEMFRDKKVLYRMDLGWTSDWEHLKWDVRTRTAQVAAAGGDAIEVHNEPNLRLEWPHGPNAWEYTQLLRVAYTEIKSVAPNIVVVSAGLAPTITTPDRGAITDTDFAREMFENGAGDYFDAFGYHPYGYNAPPEQAPAARTLNFRRAELVRRLMNEFGLGDKPIWMTEFGWLRDPSEDGINCSDAHPDFAGFAWLRVSGETQADYIVRAFAYADRYWPWAGPMFLWNLNWSMLSLETLPICSHMRWFALLKSDGEPTLAVNRVAAMPRRLAVEVPEMTLVARGDMTTEIGYACPAWVEIGQFEVRNTGYQAITFEAEIEPAISLNGPPVRVSDEVVSDGGIVTIFADTNGLDPGLYVVFVNVRTDFAGQLVSRSIRGYIVVTESIAAC